MQQSFREVLETLSEGHELSPEQAGWALQQIVEGNVSSEKVAAFLFGMRMKGESVSELTAFVKVMRKAAIAVDVDSTGAVDLCGTGGDRSGTFNISTAAMFVTAGAGVSVLKHGNRSVSSKCGSADVLEELGVVADLQKADVEKVFEETGMAFMFAPNFHPAMKHVMPARKALGIRTFFNILGPLLNPAAVRRQVVGAFSKEVAGIMIQILSNLDTIKAYTVNAHDGLDEVSISSKTEVFELQDTMSKSPEPFDPRSLGFQLAKVNDLSGGNATDNAKIISNVLDGTSTAAQRDIVLLNAAFGIQVSGKVSALNDAVSLARESINSGAAADKLAAFVKSTRQAAGLSK